MTQFRATRLQGFTSAALALPALCSLLILHGCAIHSPAQDGMPPGITDPGIAPTVYINEGIPLRIRYDGGEWETHEGHLRNKGSLNLAYADSWFGDEAVLRATITLRDPDGSEAAFVVNHHNAFVFSGSDGRFHVTGPDFHATEDPLPPSSDFIRPETPFQFQATLRERTLSISINGSPVYTTPYEREWLGEAGFRPSNTMMEISHFEGLAEALPLERYLLNQDAASHAQSGKLELASLVSVSPVALPEGPSLVTNNWHFGWPLVTRTEGAMVGFFQRGQHHHGSHRVGDANRSRAISVRSTDGGRTWSEPVDLREFIEAEADNVPGGMHLAGVSSRGTIVYIGEYGAFRSTDEGLTFTHHPDAFDRSFLDEGLRSNVGPDLVVLPDGRLLFICHIARDGILQPRVFLWTSDDDGITWQRHDGTTPDYARTVEQATLLLDDKLFFLARNHATEAFEEERRTFRFVQGHAPLFDWNFEATLTNIRSTHSADELIPLAGYQKSRAFGFWSQDTATLVENPMTGRIEAVVTNRGGGGQPDEQDRDYQTLNLWSISREEILANRGQWRFEGTLLRRRALLSSKFYDGMHPAGSFIDRETNEHVMLIYLGYYHGPAGIFQIRRSLDTSRLRAHAMGEDGEPLPSRLRR